MKVNFPVFKSPYFKGYNQNNKKSKGSFDYSDNQKKSQYPVKKFDSKAYLEMLKTRSRMSNIVFVDDILIPFLIGAASIAALFTTEAVICEGYEYYTETLPKEIEEKKKAEKEKIIAEYEKQLTQYCNEFKITREQAVQYHEQFFKNAMIQPLSDMGEQVGINAIRGYGKEKYEVAMKIIAPIVNAQKFPTDENKKRVPNGIILYGPPGSGKTYITDCLCNHLNVFNSKIIEVSLDGSNHEENSQKIRDAFNKARELFYKTKKYTIIKFKEDIDRRFYPVSYDKQFLNEMGTFLSRAENSSQEGAVWIMTANNIKDIDKAVLRRASERIAIGDMDDFEIADMIRYSLMKNYELPSALKLDYNAIIEYIKNNNLTCTPYEYEVFVNRAMNSRTEDQHFVTAEMIIDQIKNFKDFEFTLDDDTIAQFKDDKKFIKGIPNDGRDIYEEQILGFNLKDADKITEEELDNTIKKLSDEELDSLSYAEKIEAYKILCDSAKDKDSDIEDNEPCVEDDESDIEDNEPEEEDKTE